MKLQEWREKQFEERTLPSGLEVKLRKVVLLDLMANGQIPETLDALVQKASAEGFGLAEVQQFMPLVNAVVKACLVEPVLGETGDDDRLTLEEIPAMDRLDIFTWANGAANALRPFREEQAVDVESARVGEGVSQPA